MRQELRIAGVFLLVAAASCSDATSPANPTGPTDTNSGPIPNLSISDGAHGGAAHFYFLAPLVDDPNAVGAFDSGRSPVVKICELSGQSCVRALGTFTSDVASGAGRVRVDAQAQSYQLEWATGAYGLRAGATVRVHVRAAGVQLGYLDILLTDQAGSQRATGNYAALPLGTTAPIRFRIEQGAVPPSEDIVIHDNVIAVDSTLLLLVSSEAEIDEGTYRFNRVGGPTPYVTVGDVLAGPQGLGFMRTVTSLTITNNQLVAETVQATLSEIIKEGSFSVRVPLDVSGAAIPPPSGSALAPLFYMAPGVSVSNRLIEFQDMNLCLVGCPEWLSLTLPSGYVDFDTEFEWDYATRLSLTNPVDTFKVVVRGALAYDVEARAIATQEFAADSVATLLTLPILIPMPPVLWFVNARADVKLKVGYEAKATVEARAQSGIHLEAGVGIGGEYTFANGGWDPIWDPTFSVAAKETSWAAQGDGFVRVYVRPEVQLVLGLLEGPYAGLEPYLKAYGQIGTEDCRARLTWATDADVVLTASIAKLQLPKLTKEWPGEESEILNIPCPIGHLKVVTNTSGTTPDPDGYTVTLDGADARPIGTDATVVYSPLPPATYKVELTGLAEGCSVEPNPREIVVSEGDTALVAFPVTCGAPAVGGLHVSTSTTGEDDGFTVVIDGGSSGSQSIGLNDELTFYPVPVGDHTVELTDMGPTCSVLGDNPRSVTVEEGATAETDFQATCGLAITFNRGFDVWQILPDGTAEQQLTFDGGPTAAYEQVSWSPDGIRMAFTRAINNCAEQGEDCTGSAIFTSDASGFNAQQLTNVEERVFNTGPHWSPDGARIVFGHNDDRTGWEQSIMTVASGGGNITPVQIGQSPGTNYAFPSWTPDGRIVYTARVTGEDSDDGYVAVMNADGSGSQLLTSTPSARIYEPVYAGDRIAFRRMLYLTQNTFDLMLLDLAESSLTNLSNQQFAVGSIAISPDGRRIAYVQESPPGGLWLIDADGSNRIRLADGNGRPAWRRVY